MRIGNFAIKKLKIKTLDQCQKYAYEMFSICNDKALCIYYDNMKRDLNKYPTESKYAVMDILKKVMDERGLKYDI